MDYENEILKFWENKNIFEKVQKKNENGKIFSWVEGPPYPTGEAHLGHLRNWAIKDFVFRYKRFCGFNVYTKDGYDVHGLPVEQKVQKKLGLVDTNELKKFGEEKFVDECRNYVSGIIDDMKEIRNRFGLSIDLKNTYVTSHPEYISNSWKFFYEANKKKLLYKDYRCVAWSPALETTLSDYEIKDSYAILEDPSIYVRFKIKDEFTTTKYDEYLLIWTTTPWTLEANLGIAINKDFDYCKILVDKNYVLVVAKNLIKEVMMKLKIKNFEILEKFKGEKLIGIRYNHIYKIQDEFDRENYHKVFHANFVSLGEGESHLDKLEKKSFKHNILKQENKIKNQKKMDEGTGLVHQAPAHGIDDNEICRKNGIKKVVCIVDEKANMIKESMWAGMNFRDANNKIVDYLFEKKIILQHTIKKHKYPLCWRSKVPIVYRTTDQWYIKRSKIIENIKKENTEKVNWSPEIAKSNFNNLISGAGDWAISRQRFWGIPLPVFENKEDGDFLVFKSKKDLEKEIGYELEDIHLSDLKKITIKKNGKKYNHINFICDVWFDSGCASFASHYNENLSYEEVLEKYYPLDWITEGEDQMRGWFSSLFNVGYLTTGKAPYKNVLFYKFVMDKNGIKMSKSIGNGISGNDAIKNYGADKIRYYLLSKTAPQEQLNFDEKELKNINGVFNTIENIFKFCSQNLLEKEIDFNNLEIEDKFIFLKHNLTIKKIFRKL